uniref:NADH dehydrogenase [ubiquinone] 1 beta subcomplex subunit 10 n=1 Tax=Corethron hystrix TaxID=216773 RepID=A0A7S1BSX9_9STRA|mmetsp:Transcript_38337/g.89149  ORF Transcript_38337/g.89149 Transcript_38337/m.89149 type:complete len:126 (+) Transcript_38337:108-485(+)
MENIQRRQTTGIQAFSEPGANEFKKRQPDDPARVYQTLEQMSRERQIAYETVKILRQRVKECHRREGVNHYANCKKECADYLKQFKAIDYGQVQPKFFKEMKNRLSPEEYWNFKVKIPDEYRKES